MKPYQIIDSKNLLPDTVWCGTEKIIFLPVNIRLTKPKNEPFLWMVDGKKRRYPIAWKGGMAFDYNYIFYNYFCKMPFRVKRPLMTYAPFHPHKLPPIARLWIRRFLGFINTKQPLVYPRWPVEPTLEVLKSIANLSGVKTNQLPWPRKADFCLCLSHDVDTHLGQKNARKLARVEEKLGLRSAWFLAPGNYKIDINFWREMVCKGHEVGCHGYLHDFKLPYISQKHKSDRLTNSMNILKSLNPVGFRSPGFFMTPSLYTILKERYLYDSSIPDTHVVNGTNGCGTIFPYKYKGLIEIPVTLPYDGELKALGYKSEHWNLVWRKKTNWIMERGGLVHMLTHPDDEFTSTRNELDRYYAFLSELLSQKHNSWNALPKAIAASFERQIN